MRWPPFTPLIRYLIYAPFTILFFVWLVLQALALDGRFGLRLPEYLRWVSIPLFVGGGILDGYCRWLFLTVGQGTPAPFHPPKKFVAHGPYRYVRNPMIIGALVAHLGLALLLTSPILLLMTLGWTIYAHFLVLWEEKSLERRFGEAYRQYKALVRRWIPRPPK